LGIKTAPLSATKKKITKVPITDLATRNAQGWHPENYISESDTITGVLIGP
jgi:hypothetical protein